MIVFHASALILIAKTGLLDPLLNGRGEAEAIVLALTEKAQLLGIDDQNGINACKLLGITFTTAVGILVRSHEKGLLKRGEGLAKLATLAKDGRDTKLIIEAARLQLEVGR